MRLEPRGLLYVKLTLLEQWEAPALRLSELPPPSVFGVELRHLVDKEGSALPVPLLIQKSVAEIEKRGLKVGRAFLQPHTFDIRHYMELFMEWKLKGRSLSDFGGKIQLEGAGVWHSSGKILFS